MRQAQQEALCFKNGRVAHRDHPRNLPIDHLDRFGRRHPRGQAVGERIRTGCRDGLAGLERQRVAGRSFCLYADDVRARTQCVACGGDTADSRTEPDGYVDRIERPRRGEQLQGIGSDSLDERGVERRHHVQALGGPNLNGVLQRFLEIVAVNDQLAALGNHGGVFLRVVAFRHDDDGTQPLAGCADRDRLAMVAASRGDDAGTIGLPLLQAGHVERSTTNLERPDGGVVLVFDPNGEPGILAQQRPDVLRGRRYLPINDLRCRAKRIETEVHAVDRQRPVALWGYMVDRTDGASQPPISRRDALRMAVALGGATKSGTAA